MPNFIVNSLTNRLDTNKYSPIILNIILYIHNYIIIYNYQFLYIPFIKYANRLLQEDVFYDTYNWLNELDANIKKIIIDKRIQNIFMCKNNEYDIFTDNSI